MNDGLIDEIRLLVHPVALGGGKAPFGDLKERHALTLSRAEPLASGKVLLTYDTQLGGR